MKFRINLDALGVTASVACAIHCAVLPLFFSALPLFGVNILHNFWFETGMVALAFVIGAQSFRHGYQKHHHRMLPFALFSLGITLLIFKLFFVHLETWLLVPAVLLIVTAHYLNYQFCRIHEREGACAHDHSHTRHSHTGHSHGGHSHQGHSHSEHSRAAHSHVEHSPGGHPHPVHAASEVQPANAAQVVLTGTKEEPKDEPREPLTSQIREPLAS